MGCLQDQTSTSHSFFVSTKTTANSRGKKHLQTFDILALVTLKQADDGARSSCGENLLHRDQFKRSSGPTEHI